MNRDVVLVFYAVALGWCLSNWWRDEKDFLVRRAADQALRDQAELEEFRRQAAQSPAPDLEPAAAGTT